MLLLYLHRAFPLIFFEIAVLSTFISDVYPTFSLITAYNTICLE